MQNACEINQQGERKEAQEEEEELSRFGSIYRRPQFRRYYCLPPLVGGKTP